MGSNKVYIVLSTGLCLTFASFAIYLLFKRRNDEIESEFNFNKSKNKTFIKISENCKSVKIKVPKLAVPAIIGRSGLTIKEIEAKTNTSIHFDVEYVDHFNEQMNDKYDDKTNDGLEVWSEDNNDRHKICDKEEFRYIDIRGNQTNTQLAQNIIYDLIAKQIDKNICESVSIPFGCNIIGPNGETIKQICSITGARIKMNGKHYEHKRSAVIRGSDSQRLHAKQMIQNIVQSFK